jgi:hypothetical protein
LTANAPLGELDRGPGGGERIAVGQPQHRTVQVVAAASIR